VIVRSPHDVVDSNLVANTGPQSIVEELEFVQYHIPNPVAGGLVAEVT
jgi:hypothetical protein